MNLASWLVEIADKHPKNEALLKGEYCSADYATFRARSSSISDYLENVLGLKKGDRVAIFSANSTEYLEIIYAVWFLGGVVVPINSKLHINEALWIINDSGSKVLFTDEKNIFNNQVSTHLKPTIISITEKSFYELYLFSSNRIPVKINKNDLVWLFYTSGTTGSPKGVMLSSKNLQAMVKGYLSDVDTVSPSDTSLYAAPMSHGAGLYNVIFVKLGARHSVPISGRFAPLEVLKLSLKLKRVCMFLAPTMVNRLVREAEKNMSSAEGIRTIIYGGGPMYLADIIHAVKIMGPRFVQIFGQGECPMAISALKRDEILDRESWNWRERVSSVGRKQSVVDVAIKDPNGNVLPVNHIGEICVYGDPVMLGYWNNPSATESTLTDGWLKTGDLGRIDSNGYIMLEGRSKDLIISGGSNIYPREVEDVLLQCPNVFEASVVGKMDPEWGEIVVAFIVGTEITFDDLDLFCIEKISRFKRPREYIFLDSLPKNNYGKILKKELRNLLERKRI